MSLLVLVVKVVPSSYREAIRHGSPLLLAMVLASLAVYGFHFYASRRLGVDLYGALASLLSTVTLISSASQIGATIVARFAAEFDALKDLGRLRRLFDVTALACGGTLIGGVGLTALFQAQLASFFHLGSGLPIVLTALVCGLVFAGNVLRGLLQGIQKFSRFSISFVVENVGRAVLGSVAVALAYGIDGAFAAQIVAAACAVAYTYTQLARVLRAVPVRLHIDVRRLALTSSGIAVGTACLAVLSYFDVVLAKHYLGEHDAGLYGFGTLPGRTLSAITFFLPTLILPKATATASGQRKTLGILFAGLGAATGFLVVALIPFYLLPHWIVFVAGGQQYVQAAPLVFPYGCAAGVFGLTRIAVSYNVGIHRFGFVTPLFVVTAAEIAGIAVFHRDPAQIVSVVLAANVLALAASLLPVTRLARS